MAAKRILVVYYSDSGQTRHIAEQLASALSASVERLVAPGLGSGGWGFMRRMWQSLRGGAARLVEPAFDPDRFDMVVVGSPVWAGRVASPVRAWLRRYAGRVKAGAAFVSFARSGAGGALAELERLMPGRVRARLTVSDDDRAKGRDAEKIRTFAAAVDRLAEQAAPPPAPSAAAK